jgi:hypothetical protein
VLNLRVFGCLAYVHVQKDQRRGLVPHTKKCVFLGYPQDYPGWLFWNPVMKKTIISDRADFDERYFPGNTANIPDAVYAPAPVPSLYTPTDNEEINLRILSTTAR